MTGERWEAVIEHEIKFYLRYETQYKREIEERLLENEMDIQYPITYVNYAEGKMYRYCPGTEEQALKRIEVRESLNKLLEHAEVRLKRLFRHFNELSVRDQLVLRLIYFESNVSDLDRIQRLGLSNRLELDDAKIGALQALYELYRKDRAEQEKEMRTIFQEAKKSISNKKATPSKPFVSALNIIRITGLPVGIDQEMFMKQTHQIPSTGARKKVSKMSSTELREVLNAELSNIS